MSVELRTFEDYKKYFSGKPNKPDKWEELIDVARDLVDDDKPELALRVAGLFASVKDNKHLSYQDRAYRIIATRYARTDNTKLAIDVALRAFDKSPVFLDIVHTLVDRGFVDSAMAVVNNYGKNFNKFNKENAQCHIAKNLIHDPIKRDVAVKILTGVDFYSALSVFKWVISRSLDEETPTSLVFLAKAVATIGNHPSHQREASLCINNVIEVLYKKKIYNLAKELRDIIPDNLVRDHVIFKEEDFPTAPPPPFPKIS